MLSNSLMKQALLRASVGAVALAFAVPAWAQVAADPSAQTPDQKAGSITSPAETSDDNAPQTIVVTGSRIRSPNLESAVPITSFSGDQLFKTSEVSIGDKLNELPSIRSTFGTANSTRFLGTAGLNLLDLRGLGTQRTLVLVNGRRFVGADILNNGVSPDINNIPSDLVDRVDIITGGQSAVYGSDAIAGVVNFVLKDHYDGLQIRGQGGISRYGDAGAYRTSILAGKNFAEDRGNITVSGEYSHQSAFYGTDRPSIRNTQNFVVVDTDPANAVNGSDGVPDRMFFQNIRSATISNGGLVFFSSPTGACGRDKDGVAFRCPYLFQPDGTLVPETGQRIGLAPNGNFLGGNGSNLREGQQLALQPREDRLVGNLMLHYEISPALVPFLEATYSRVKTTAGQSGPAFFQGSTLDANLERPRLDNPFLSPQARALITQQLIAAGTPAASITGATKFVLNKNLLDLGVRNEKFDRETYRIVGGLRGDLGSNWHYEVSGNYGHFSETNTVQGNLNVQRFLLAMDSTRNAAGQIVCRAQINPAAANSIVNNVTGDPQNLIASDIASCVPFNPFGQGNVTQAMRNYVLQDTVARGKITQTVINGFISGDSGKWFNLPGGPIGIVLGGEYRRETNSYVQDPLVSDGYTFYNSIPALVAPAFVVKEAYGEIQLPILKDVPFFQELTAKGAGRVSHYNGATGTTWTYNGDLIWRPIRDIMFRGGYGRSVRAPNLSELYSQQSQNFAPAFVDPCSARNIATGSSFRVANCAAAGIPTSYDFVYTQSLQTVSGGNPNLTAETSDSYTLGTVITPRWVRGLSISVDYYNITVNNVISSLSAQQIANQCYDSPSLVNPFCGSFRRQAAGTTGPKGEIPFQIVEGSLLQSALNFAKLKARGIDVDISYNHRFGRAVYASHLQFTHVLQRDDYLNPSDPNFRTQNLGQLGDPYNAFNWTNDVQLGKVTFSYEMRFIGKMFLGAPANILSINGLPPQNLDYADRVYYPRVFYHNVRLGLDVTDRFNIYFGVDNLTNRMPPFGLTGVGDGSGIYDNRGRFMYTGVVAKF